MSSLSSTENSKKKKEETESRGRSFSFRYPKKKKKYDIDSFNEEENLSIFVKDRRKEKEKEKDKDKKKRQSYRSSEISIEISEPKESKRSNTVTGIATVKKDIISISQEKREELLKETQLANKQAVKKLIEKEPGLACVPLNSKEETLLHILVSEGQKDLVQWLLSQKAVLENLEFNINAKDANSWTSLHLACIEKNLEMCKILLMQEGIDSMSRTNEKYTPLHFFVRHSLDATESIEAKLILQLMTRKGVEIEAVSKDGESSLFQACYRGSPVTIQYLLDKGADINLTNNMGETPLHFAVRRGNLGIVVLLTTCSSKRPDWTKKGHNGTPYDIALAAKYYDIAAFINNLTNDEAKCFILKTENWMKIFMYLSVSQLAITARTCKKFHSIINSDAMWETLLKKRYPKFRVQSSLNSLENFKSAYSQEKAVREIRRFKKKKYDMKKVLLVQKYVRIWFYRNHYKKLLRMNKTRDNIVREIYETEETYINGLELLVNQYLNPIKEKKFFNSKDYSKLFDTFAEVETILGLSKLLSNNFKTRLDHWSPCQKIGDVFLTHTEFLKLYTQYVNNVGNATAMVKEFESKDKTFKKWLKERRADPKVNKQDLYSFLILPVQRIPRYEMLLDQLLKNTWKDHLDYEHLAQSLQKMKQTAQYVNEKKRDADNLQLVTDIQNSLNGRKEIIALPHRRLLKQEDFREIVSGSVSQNKITLKSRHLFLFNDMLLVTKKENVHKSKVSYTWVEKIDLSRATLNNNIDPNELGNDVDKSLVFQLEVSSPFEDSKVEKFTYHTFVAEKLEEKNEWNTAISVAIKEAVSAESIRKEHHILMPTEREDKHSLTSFFWGRSKTQEGEKTQRLEFFNSDKLSLTNEKLFRHESYNSEKDKSSRSSDSLEERRFSQDDQILEKRKISTEDYTQGFDIPSSRIHLIGLGQALKKPVTKELDKEKEKEKITKENKDFLSLMDERQQIRNWGNQPFSPPENLHQKIKKLEEELLQEKKKSKQLEDLLGTFQDITALVDAPASKTERAKNRHALYVIKGSEEEENSPTFTPSNLSRPNLLRSPVTSPQVKPILREKATPEQLYVQSRLNSMDEKNLRAIYYHLISIDPSIWMKIYKFIQLQKPSAENTSAPVSKISLPVPPLPSSPPPYTSPITSSSYPSPYSPPPIPSPLLLSTPPLPKTPPPPPPFTNPDQERNGFSDDASNRLWDFGAPRPTITKRKSQSYIQPVSTTRERSKSIPIQITASNFNFNSTSTFEEPELVLSYEDLKNKKVPPDLDLTKLEFHLSNEEFVRVLGFTKKEWINLPQWKRDSLKKQTHLF